VGAGEIATDRERERVKRQSSFTCKHKMSGNCKTAAIPTTSGNGNQLNNNNGARSQDIYALQQ